MTCWRLGFDISSDFGRHTCINFGSGVSVGFVCCCQRKHQWLRSSALAFAMDLFIGGGLGPFMFSSGFVHCQRLQRFSLSVGIGFGGGFSIGFVLLRWLCLPVAAVAVMTVCLDFQGLLYNNCVSMLSL